ncbi:MAG: hypothetical protein ABJB01_05425 [Rudaea sp.]
MKTALLAALAGSTLTFALGAYTEEAITQSGAPGILNLTAHDAAGRTFQASAIFNDYSINGATITVDYTSDQFLCSAFGQ